MSTGLKLFATLTLACIGLLIVSDLVLEHSSALTLTQVLTHYHWLFSLWHVGLYELTLILWPYFIQVMGKRQKWSPQTVIYLSNQRTKLLILFVMIELLFVYNVVGHVLAWI